MSNRFEDEQPRCLATSGNVLRLCRSSQVPTPPLPCQFSDVPPRLLLPEGSASARTAVQRLVKPAYRAAISHISLTAMPIANITSGILVANQHYDRLPGPLLLAVLFSFLCAIVQKPDQH